MIIYCKECGKNYDEMEGCTLYRIIKKTIQRPRHDLEKGNYEMDIFCPCYLCPEGHEIEKW